MKELAGMEQNVYSYAGGAGLNTQRPACCGYSSVRLWTKDARFSFQFETNIVRGKSGRKVIEAIMLLPSLPDGWAISSWICGGVSIVSSHMCASSHVWKPEHNLQKSLLSTKRGTGIEIRLLSQSTFTCWAIPSAMSICLVCVCMWCDCTLVHV